MAQDRKRVAAYRRLLTYFAATALCGSACGLAQAEPAPVAKTSTTQLGEIVVIGTQIRGAAPVGSVVIGLDRADIELSAPLTTNDLLRQVPQVFNGGVTEGSRNTGGGASNLTYGSALNIRGIGPYATLTLFNGRRAVPQGTTGFALDPSIVPVIAVERVEILADGSSAIYGSDAIAGVGNIVLRRNVEGGQMFVQAGAADGYETHQYAGIFGHAWDSGRFTVSISESYHSALKGEDRSFYRADQRSFGGADYRNTLCNPGTLTMGGVSYAIPAGGVTAANRSQLTPNTRNRCENQTLADLLPRQRRQSLAFTFDQDLTPGISMFVDGFAHYRSYRYTPGATTATLTVPTTNAFYVAPVGAAGAQTVGYSFEGELPRNVSSGFSRAVQATVGARFDLPHDWRAETYLTNGRNVEYSAATHGLNNAAVSAALASSNPATALDPYGLNRTSSAVLAAISNGQIIARGVTTLTDFAVKLDGPVLETPGGTVRAALGYEGQIFDVRSTSRQGTAVAPSVVTTTPPTRRVQSVYAELHVPIVGDDNGRPGLRGLELALAGRYDSYSDVGNTSNPKIGVDWTPFDGVKVHASYGTSFRAPVAIQTYGASNSIFVQNYFDPTIGANRVGIAVGGANLDLEPETSTTHSLGVDFTPRAVPGLKLTATYFSVQYDKQIAGYLSDTSLLQREAQFAGSGVITRNPSAEVLSQFLNRPVVGVLPSNVTLLIDGRSRNLGSSTTQGIDVAASYPFATGLGDWTATLAASYLTKYTFAVAPAAAQQDLLNTIYNPLRLKMRASLSWRRGDLDASVRANYVNSYKNNLVTPIQKVDAHTSYDVHLGYKLGSLSDSAIAKGVALSVDVTNLLDDDPPYVNGSPGANGGGGFDPTVADPVGRLISVSISKTF